MMTPPDAPPAADCGIPVKGAPPPPGVAGPPLLHSNPTNKGAGPEFPCHIDRKRWGNPEFLVEPVLPEEAAFRHSGWAPRRNQIFRAFERIHVGEKRLDKFVNCGSGMFLQMNAAHDDTRIVCNTCGDRWCTPCATCRAARIRETIARQLDDHPTRFITLTLRHNQTTLRDQIDRCWQCFTTLRRRRLWRDHVTGGASIMEIKLGSRDNLWHVHLHIVCEGKFLDQRELSREWHAVTGDSSIVDIRKVNDGPTVAAYLTKYITKPADSSVFAVPSRLDEMILALKGRRLCATFGSWRGIKLEDHPPPDPNWSTVARLDTLASRLADGDPEARRWMEVVARRWPEAPAAFGWPLDTS